MALHKAIRTIWISILVSVLLALVKGVTGILGNSYALVADGIESLSDVFSSLLVLLGLKYANRPADLNHPYGHGKAETLATFAVAGFLTVSAGLITVQAIDLILTPHPKPEPYTLIVLAFIVVIKEGFYRFIKKRGEESNSLALQADAWHHRSDALTSVAAFVGISIALLMGEGYETADDWAALVAAAVILLNAYFLVRPAIGEIMDEHTHGALVEQIRQVAGGVEGVINTEKCHIRKSGTRYFVDLHAEVDGNLSVREGHEIAHRLKDALQLKIPHLADVLVHIEPAAE